MKNNNKEALVNLPIFECFKDLKDPRVEGRSKHLLIEIIVIAICGILCGAQGWTQIEEFGRQRYEWLKEFLSLPYGIPSHDTFGNVFSLICGKAFGQCFWQWTKLISKLTQGEIIALDGKSLRGSHKRCLGETAIHLVNAFATSNGLFLAHEKVTDKSNEIKAIPKLLKLLEIKGCIITIDAMGCQKGIANLIVQKEGDWLFGLKGNQGRFHQNVERTFLRAKELNYEAMVYKTSETIEKDHGRVEQRNYRILPLMYLYQFKKDWPGLQTFIEVERVTYSQGKERKERNYYISSLGFKEHELIAQAIRKHWHVENRLHFALDVSFREDECRIRRKNAAENFSILRKFVLNMFRLKDKNSTQSIYTRRLKAAWNTSYLAQLIGLTL